MTDIQHLERDGIRLAYAHRPGTGPTIVFLPGYASDMEGTKALTLDAWAAREGRAMLRFDYAGCGASEGAFEEGTLTGWRDDALHLIDTLIEGPVILVGSSMGGWIMLLIALARADRIAGLVGVAAAPDFTGWGFTEEEKIQILSYGRYEKEFEAGPPMVTTRAFWQSGEANRLLRRPLDIDCPVRLLHGQRDADVPWHHSTHLAGQIRSDDVQIILVKDGDHRLSRDADLLLLVAAVQGLTESP